MLIVFSLLNLVFMSVTKAACPFSFAERISDSTFSFAKTPVEIEINCDRQKGSVKVVSMMAKIRWTLFSSFLILEGLRSGACTSEVDNQDVHGNSYTQCCSVGHIDFPSFNCIHISRKACASTGCLHIFI